MMRTVTNVRPVFAMPEDFFSPRCLTNENIHYDVDENLWPNPQDGVEENIEVQWGTLQLTFYCSQCWARYFKKVISYSY